MDKNNQSEKKNKSFYFACVICAVAVIAAGFVVANSLAVREKANNEVALPTPTPQMAAEKKIEQTPPPKPTEPPISEVAADPIPKQELANTKLMMPVNGIITVQHSFDTMVYSPTFGDWRTHKGIDIEAEHGTQIKAVANGTVEAVYADEMMGNVIEINHGDFVSVYAGVASLEGLQQGQEIGQGDVISTTGNTAVSESAQPTHLHFELFYGGNSVDPIEYLKE